ncbi:MAG TPA: NHL repeat-containing protein [Planctomycetaceae bacterium]|nr:NHL repeat-containing protein [Planctomycetaceae bacterium]
MAIPKPVGADSILYVANNGSDTIQQITPGGVGSVFASTAMDPTGIAINSSGDVYVAIYNNSTIEKFSSAGTYLGVFASQASTGLSAPYGLAFGSNGNLYVAGNNTILEITSGGVSSVFASTGLSDPRGLAFDSSGNLYVANNGTNTAATAYIEKFTPAGVGSIFANSGLNGPSQLAFDRAGDLYAANFNNGTVEEFTPGGVGSQFASGLTDPIGLAFNSSGNLFVAQGGYGAPGTGTIDEFTPGGVESFFSTLPLSDGRGLYYMAFEPTPTPEPTTITMLVSGFLTAGGFGLVRRRRGRANSGGIKGDATRDATLFVGDGWCA